jgi:hypothetical protein
MAIKESSPKIAVPMKTAKEIAFKAYCANLPKDVDYATADLQIRFDNWWGEWFHRGEHRECFYHKHDLYLDGKRYIQAE